jgi:hypothetical protein
MEFHLELWHLFGMLVTLIGGYWALITIIVRQFNASLTTRFSALETARSEESRMVNERFDRIEASQRTLDREVMTLRVELPDKYVRREDAIRSEMTLHAKFDGLAARIDMFLKGKNND